MIAHVAEIGESRGRVVLRFCSGGFNKTAVHAAFRIAQAFQSEIESLYVEDTQLLDLAQFSFATEVSLTGRNRRRLSPQSVHESFLAAHEAARRQVEAAAREAEVPVEQHYVRDEPVQALAAACARRGPWNVVALAESFGTSSCGALRELFDTVPDTTAVILAGPNSRRTTGPIIVAAEDLERLPGMLRAAERLATLNETEIVLLLIGETDEDLFWMDSEVRLLLEDRTDFEIMSAALARGVTSAVVEAIRRLHGGFLIAHFGSRTVPDDGGLRPLVSALECPLLLVR